jgi:hypothetical protein
VTVGSRASAKSSTAAAPLGRALGALATISSIAVLSGCSESDLTGGTCIETNLGGEICGDEAVAYCKDLEADDRKAKREDRRQLRRDVEDARELATEIGEDPDEAERDAREDYVSTSDDDAVSRQSDRVCKDLYEAEGVD